FDPLMIEPAFVTTPSHDALFTLSSVHLRFFSSRADGLDGVLPSFPTRRSSDLALTHATRRLRQAPRPATGRAAAGRAALVKVRRDRKSTRLNSSHVKISYAVFCLKKKTNLAMYQ